MNTDSTGGRERGEGGEVVLAPLPGSNPASDGYECDGCGACCGAYLIFASVEDARREPRIEAETQRLGDWLETPRWAYRLHPLPFHDSCCFLDAERRCSIYETRPEVCREFAAGSEPCQTARAMRALPALAPLARESTRESGE